MDEPQDGLRSMQILNSVGAGICRVRDRRVEWANAAFLEMFGYEEGELAGACTSRLYSSEADFERVGAEGYSKLKTGANYSTEAQMRRKDGTRFWCAVTAQAADPQRPGGGSIWTLLDVTERHEAEESLRRERAFTEAVLESVPGLLYVYDDEGRLVRWNKEHEIATGYTSEQLRGMHLLDWYRNTPEDAARISAAVQRVAVDGRARAEANLQARDGRFVRFLFTAVNLQIDSRSYFVGVGLDITDRVRAEEAVRESRERLELALRGADLGSWDWNLQTDAATFDARWAEMLGYRLEDIRPRTSSWEALVHPDDLPGVREAFAAHLSGSTPFYESEHRLRHRSGEWIWVLSRARWWPGMRPAGPCARRGRTSTSRNAGAPRRRGASSRSSSSRRRRWKPWAGWPVASLTTSTTCSPPFPATWNSRGWT